MMMETVRRYQLRLDIMARRFSWRTRSERRREATPRGVNQTILDTRTWAEEEMARHTSCRWMDTNGSASFRETPEQ
jgi:hypothetical protein